MKYTFAFFATLFLFLFTACDSNQAGFSSGDIKVNSHDVHTFSNPAEARATHLNLDLEADFERKILKGTATWDVTHDGARWVIFDTDNLKISKVEVKAKNKEPQDTDFSLGKTDEMLGRALKVHLDADVNQVIIYYETSPTAEALQWLEPSQTSTSKPFMFSQGQAILTRSWVPIQDSPSNRITYEATIKTPKELMAVMSAENPKQRNESGEYVFKMPQPIPPYLMAIAIGNLRFKAIGDQTGVYAEPGNVDFAAREFAQVDDMMEAAERLYGPYPWGRYDILVLPPSFPFGGMENPKLTFATPTILVGDSSLTSLIAHELAHSWSGNLVTNATWDDFWLNEGITTYIERRIMEEVSGRDYADMLLTLGRQDLQDDLDDLDEVDQHLRLNLKGRNPDDGMTDIAYEKGSLLMQTLEQEVGRDKFDAFLRNYFGTHQFQTITTDQFIAYTKRNLLEPNDSNFDLTAWIDQPGIPSTAIDAPTSKRFAEVDSLRATFIAGQLFPKFTTSSWSTNEWLYFIRGFPVNVDGYRLSQLDKIYKLKDSDNAEIAAAWYELALRNGYGNEILPEIEAFLIRVGRRKFLTPIYRAMKERGLLAEARSTYAKARPGYHAVTRGTIDELLGV
jgi:aminopeptidase N